MSALAKDDLPRIIDLIEPVVCEEGCELLDARIVFEEGRKILRLFLDKPGGVILEDCGRVSHAVEDLLEVEEAVAGHYHLEVSSPGIERPLRKREHFEGVVGEWVNVTTKEKIEGRKRYKGVLKGFEGDDLIIHIDNQDFQVPFSQLSKAHLVDVS